MITTIKISGQLRGNLVFAQYLFDKTMCLKKIVNDDIYITFPTKWQSQKALRDMFKLFKAEGRPLGGNVGIRYEANKSLSYFKTKAEILN